MKLKEYLELKNIGLLEFNILFRNIEKVLLDDFSNYKLIINNKVDVAKSDIKKLILHNLIFGICESIINYKHGKKCVLIINDNFLDNSEIIQYTDKSELIDLIQSNLKQISKLLPIPVMFIHDDILSLNNNSGEVMEFKCILLSKLNDLDSKNYSFRKIRKFCSDNELTFLTSEYFNNINSHQILM